MRMRAIAAVCAAILAAASGAHAAGSFVCERSPTVEVRKQAGGSFAFQNIVNEYRVRWDADEARRQCQAFAAGKPADIGCLNGRGDWTASMGAGQPGY